MRSSHGRVTMAILAGLLLCSFGLPVVAVGGSSAMSDTTAANAEPSAIVAPEFEADRTIFLITALENGSAEWTFRYEQRLESDAAVADFESYAERFNDEETESYRNFRQRASALTASGSNVTDREMTATSFDREARIEERAPAGEEFAVIEMSFLWSNLAERDGETRIIGDVFVDGLYVGPDQELRFERGPTVRFESATPDPDSMAAGTVADSETISWIGETQFTDRQPRVVYGDRNATDESTSPEPETETESDTDSDVESPSTAPSAGDGWLLPLVVIVVVLLLGAGGAVAYRSEWGQGTAETETVDPADGSERAVENDSAGDGSLEPEPAPEPDTAGSTVAGGSGSVSEITDAEFLSDEERVVALLESNGGRMKQVDIVDNTTWSKSKVSMLLSDMDSEGTISKLRVGRENIVSLAGHEPDAAGSPFDEE